MHKVTKLNFVGPSFEAEKDSVKIRNGYISARIQWPEGKELKEKNEFFPGNYQRFQVIKGLESKYPQIDTSFIGKIEAWGI